VTDGTESRGDCLATIAQIAEEFLQICPETSNAGLSSVLIFFVLPTEIQKAESCACVGLQRTGYHVMRESMNRVSETALILASLTADNYRAEQLSAKVASMRTVLPTFLILF